MNKIILATVFLLSFTGLSEAQNSRQIQSSDITTALGYTPIRSLGGMTGVITCGAGLTCGSQTIISAPNLANITGLGAGVAASLALSVGSVGAIVTNGGALGIPASGTATNLTGVAAGLTAGTVVTNANLTGDVTSVGNAAILPNVNSGSGTIGGGINCASITSNTKGLITSTSSTPCTPAISSVSGLGTGVGTALAVNIGSAGAPVLFNGALGTPSAGVGTNLTALNASNLGSGTVAAARMPALTGDCTTSAGAVATTCTSINGVNQTTAWTNYTPTISASSGTFTAATANGYYRQIGKTVCVRLQGTQTTLGTASGTLQITLPFNSSSVGIGQVFVAVNVVNGMNYNAQVGLNSSTMNVFKYDGTTAIGASNIINIQGCYESV